MGIVGPLSARLFGSRLHFQQHVREVPRPPLPLPPLEVTLAEEVGLVPWLNSTSGMSMTVRVPDAGLHLDVLRRVGMDPIVRTSPCSRRFLGGIAVLVELEPARHQILSPEPEDDPAVADVLTLGGALG